MRRQHVRPRDMTRNAARVPGTASKNHKMNVLVDETTLVIEADLQNLASKFHFGGQGRSRFPFQRCESNDPSLTEKIKMLEYIFSEAGNSLAGAAVSTVAAKISRGKPWRRRI